MKLDFLRQNKGSKANLIFQSRFINDLNFCGLTENQKKGLLFFTSIFTASDADLKDKFLPSLNLFAISTGRMEDYGEINDYTISRVIYTANHLLHVHILDGKSLDNELRRINVSSGETQILGKTPLNAELLHAFSDKFKFKVEPLTKFYTLIFELIGEHLTEAGFDLQKAYCAGWAYFSMQCHFDLNGTIYMMKSLRELLPPLYDALTSYPKLFILYEKEFQSCHLFSTILQYYYNGIEPDILQPIHMFHQHIFYEPGTTNLRQIWQDFDDENLFNLFLNAAKIRSTNFYEYRHRFLLFNIANSGLKNKSLAFEEFFNEIQKIIIDKYNYGFKSNVIGRGELMQFYSILFYQTCIHSMVLDDLDFGSY